MLAAEFAPVEPVVMVTRKTTVLAGRITAGAPEAEEIATFAEVEDELAT
jgi:hypothetical protein